MLEERPLDERLIEALEKLDRLEIAAWALFSALEGKHITDDEILRAKRRLGLVFSDL